MRKKSSRFFYSVVVASILILQAGVSPASAAVNFTVNSTADAVDASPGDGVCQTATPGECTLRAAVQEANALAGADTITVPAGTYTLSIAGAGENAAATGDLDITESVTITGAGAAATIVDANNLDRAFQDVSGTLVISDLTVQHGLASPGGGILVNSQATITHVSFENNQSTSTLADGTGGGVMVGPNATTTISLSEFDHNFAYFGGGAASADNVNSTITVNDSTFDTNSSHFGAGAIYPNGTLAIVKNSTFLNNSADTGGAIHSNATTVQITNSTFVGNTAVNDAALDSRQGVITVNNSTFHGNTASGNGSTIGSQPVQGGSLQIRNSIIDGTNANNCSAVGDLGNNLSFPLGNNCPGTQADPQLAALANNGGNTQTMAISAGSPAIDAGNNATCESTDQRGVARPQGPACDIGAYEAGPANPTQTGPTFTVNVANDNDGACTASDCSLREAITAANSAANGSSPDSIVFSLEGAATISPASALPTVTDPVSIDGGNNVKLDGSGAGAGTNGLTFATGGSAVQGLEITGFHGAGIVVTSGTGNVFQNNSLHDNDGVGIDLGGDGATFDHQGTISGPNAYQNYPILNIATSNGSSLRLVGTLDSAASQSYVIDVYSSPSCDASSFGEGRTYLGSFPVTTDGSGTASFDHTISAGAAEPHVITATATGNSGTSEFSYCRPVATPNLNWFQAQAVGSGSSTQQYLTDRFQEKWFKFSVQPGDTVHVTLTGGLGSAISLHSDPNVLYNQLTNPQSAVALSVQAADSAFLPSGSLPSGSLPSGSLPSGSLPSGSLPSGSLETGFLPSGSLPSGSLPSGSLPSGSLPSGSLPSGSLPSGSLPSGSLPSGSLPSGSLPSGSLPSGSLPSGSLPSGSLPSGSLPSGSLPSGSLPSGSLPSGSLPSGSLDAYATAARRSLLGISMDPYATVQTIERATYDTGGDLYVRVVGPFSLTDTFKLDVTVLGGECGGVQFVPGNLAVMSGSPQGSNLQTLILTDSGRLHGTSAEIATALSDLQGFAARPDVNGVVIDLHDAQYQRVAFANSQADQNPTCPAAKNMVATEIKAVIDAYRAANTSGGSTTLQYLVLAGGADVIPFYQIPDVAGLANEKDYVAPVAPNTPSEAGLKTGQVEGQDFYGSQSSLTQAGLTLALPDLAVGRLVDTAQNISTAIQTYVTANGVITPHSSLVTGYDFVGDAAAAIKTEMDTGTNSQADTLIELPGFPPSDPTAWTADQLRAKLLTAHHDVVVLTGHFSAGSLLAADYSTGLAASEIAAPSVSFNNTLVLALGCHGGYSIPSSDLLQNASPNPDWAKAFLAKGAAGYVSASGYAYGDTELTEYGERLFVGLSQQLRTGTGSISIGQALVAAKQTYVANTAQLTGIDQKTLVEMTLYGLPMMKVNMPGQRITPPSASSIVSGTTPFNSGPAAATNLTSTTVTLSPVTHPNTLSLPNLSNNSPVTTTYLSGADGVIANPFEPLYPKDIFDITVASAVLRGIAFYGGTYSDQTGIVPLTSAPTTEVSVPHLSFNTPVFYPTQIWMPNFSDALDGGRTRLVTIPAQFQSSGPGSIDGTLRTFNSVKLKLYYLPANWADAGSPASIKAAAVSPGPSILGASAVANGGNVDFSVNATADGSAGVQAVWVLYTGKPGTPYFGEWFPLDLAATANDPTRWEGTLALQGGANAQDLLFMVEAVGGAGFTNLATNLGAFYSVTPENAGQQPPPAATTIQLQSPPASGTYLKDSTFSAVLTSNGQPLASQVVSINVGGQQALATTDSGGVASAILKLVVPPDPYTLQASFAGNSSYIGSVDTASFTVNKDSTSVQVSGSPATINTGDVAPIIARVLDSSGQPLGGKSIFFIVHNNTDSLTRSVIADYQGNAPLGSVSLPAGVYTVDAYFSGTIPLTPTPLTLSDDYYSESKHLGASLTVVAAVDSTAPVITASATRADHSAYIAGTWTNQAVTVHFTCSDTGSGVASCPADQTFSNVGTFTANGTATDHAGNSASASFGPIQIDKTLPTIHAAIVSGIPGFNGWFLTNVTVRFTCSDGTGSGIPSGACPAQQVLSTEGLAVSSTAQTVTDAAGNVSTPSNVITVKIDKTKPTINPTVSPNPVVLNGSATANPGAADSLSGLALQVCDEVTTKSVGTKSVGCLAADKAGNIAVAKVSYRVIYRFDGFLQPVNDTGHPLLCVSPCPTSIFKGGSTVTLTFQLKDVHGNVVKSVQAPVWVSPQKGSATSAAINEAVSSTKPSTGTTFRLSSNRYIYDWGTKGFATGFLWQIGVQLDDGQTYFVTIGLR